jgi:hypothetical protein
VPGTDFISYAQRSGEQFRYAADFGKVDDPESGSYFPLSFLFWGWLWGVPGMRLAVPILATVKIFCDRVDSLTQLGEFLGD